LTKAQTVNGEEIQSLDADYIQIVGTTKILSNKLNIHIDYGQEQRVFDMKDTPVLNKNGEKVEFKSMMDALNFMSKFGYEYADAYALTAGNGLVYYYVMKKKNESS
jgi:hypothetical protein